MFDRVKTSHLVNLFDMNYKYGDVLSADELRHQLRASASAEG